MGYIVDLLDNKLELFSDKVILNQTNKTLIISDLHIGKAEHFRKNGIPIPTKMGEKDLSLISNLLDVSGSKHIIFLGDLFHADLNTSITYFKDWLSNHTDVKFDLIIGNHDVLPKSTYLDLNMSLYQTLTMNNLKFQHHPPSDEHQISETEYILCGHVHPAVYLSGKNRKGERLPCFVFKKGYGILPAFGSFTGKYNIEPSPEDVIYAIAGREIFKL